MDAKPGPDPLDPTAEYERVLVMKQIVDSTMGTVRRISSTDIKEALGAEVVDKATHEAAVRAMFTRGMFTRGQTQPRPTYRRAKQVRRPGRVKGHHARLVTPRMDSHVTVKGVMLPNAAVAQAVYHNCLLRGWGAQELSRASGVSVTAVHGLLSGDTRLTRALHRIQAAFQRHGVK